MTAPKEGRLNAWRIVRPIVKPLVPVCYKVFPESRNIRRYRDTFGRMPNVIRPKRFNEKIMRKILFDRNPKLTLFADKLLVREFVRSRLGDDRCLTKLYGVVKSTAEIGQLQLPSKFVMKPNHASGSIRIVMDSSSILPGELESLAAKWLQMNYYDSFQEWAYKNIRPRVMFEELLEVAGDLADDYKFFCFEGEPRMFLVSKDGLRKPRINYYDMNHSLLTMRVADHENFHDELKAPANFDELVEVASRLSAGTDFLRVDLYNVNGRVVFGELTNYPGGGLNRYLPPEWDLKLGSYWR